MFILKPSAVLIEPGRFNMEPVAQGLDNPDRERVAVGPELVPPATSAMFPSRRGISVGRSFGKTKGEHSLDFSNAHLDPQRHYCGSLLTLAPTYRPGTNANRNGWVHRRRYLGNLLFLDTPRTAPALVPGRVFNKENATTASPATAEQARTTSSSPVEGNVINRQKANPELPALHREARKSPSTLKLHIPHHSHKTCRRSPYK